MSSGICGAAQLGGNLANDGDSGTDPVLRAAIAVPGLRAEPVTAAPPSEGFMPGAPRRLEAMGPGTIGASMAKEPPEHPGAKPGGQKAATDKQGIEKQAGEQQEKTKRPQTKGARSSTAFDLWLQRELQDMFSDVSNEPLPDELLRLIDESKAKK